MTSLRERLGSLPLQAKVSLVAGAATVLGSLVAVAGLMYFELSRAPSDLEAELGSVVRATAYQARASLVFANPTDATEQLRYLAEFQEIRQAWIRTSDGKTFATFSRKGFDNGNRHEIEEDGAVFFEDHVVLRQSIRTGSVVEGVLFVEADLSRVVAIRQRLLALGVVAALLGIITSSVLIYPLRIWLTRPILALASVAQRVKQERRHDLRAESAGRDEVGLLVEAFNDMLDGVQEREKRLEEARAEALRLLDDRSRQTNELELANAQLKAEINERQRLQEQLLQSQKMESIGQLAGGIAHDFNNLLTVILGWTEYAGGTDKDAERMSEGLEQIQHSAERAATLTRQLLAFARGQVIRPEILSMNELVQGLRQILTTAVGEGISLEFDLAADLEKVFVDPGQFEQIFLNMAINARDAMPSGGTLTIQTTNGPLPAELMGQVPATPESPYVQITIADTGKGIPSELHDKIFEPFFTTKEKGKGTGLGLAMCYGIVRQSDGVLTVESEPAQGTRFHIFLPSHMGQEMEAEAAAEELPAELAGDETILIVEDQPEVRALIEKSFKMQGYQVLVAMDGSDGVALGLSKIDQIDLVITDLKMPGIDGRQLLARLRQERPELPALLISGHASELTDAQPLPERVNFVKKPFTPSKLLREARVALGDETIRSSHDDA